MSIWRKIFGGSMSGLAQQPGPQGTPTLQLGGANYGPVGTDQALGLTSMWRAAAIISETISTLPLFVYQRGANGQRELARNHRLWRPMHSKANAYMTANVALASLCVNKVLHNNAYAEIIRNGRGDAVGYMPLPTEQVSKSLLEDGSLVYAYQSGSVLRIVSDQNMIHWQGMGNGFAGLHTLAYASNALGLGIKIEGSSSDLFANAGKLHGFLSIDAVLRDEQREALGQKFKQLSLATNSGRQIPVLEAGMKFQSIQQTAEQQQLATQRRFTVEDVGRITGVPSILLNENSGTSAWGSGVAEIKEAFATFALRPLCKGLELEFTEKMFTPAERQSMDIEFSFDGLLRASPEKRAQIYKEGIQNGYTTPNEVRQLENLPPKDGGDRLFMQQQMAPIETLNGAQTSPQPSADPTSNGA